MGAANLYSLIGEAQDVRTPSPEDEAAKQEYWEIVRAALEPRQFSVVQMYFRESNTQEDIADRLGVSQPLVFDILSKSLDRLRGRKVRKQLESAIPAARKPPVAGHVAMHAYQISYAPGESPEDKEFDREQAREIRDDQRNRDDSMRPWFPAH